MEKLTKFTTRRTVVQKNVKKSISEGKRYPIKHRSLRNAMEMCETVTSWPRGEILSFLQKSLLNMCGYRNHWILVL